MLGTLDRYIARRFLEPFITATVVIVGLYVVGEAFGHLDDYLRESDSIIKALWWMVQYHTLRAPGYAATVVPIAMLVGAAYGISQLSARNEIMAMKASGVSFWRALLPIYVLAIIVSVLAVINREGVVPHTDRMAQSVEDSWKTRQDKFGLVMDRIREEETQFIMLYNPSTRRARNVLVIRQEPGQTPAHFIADEAEPVRGGWALRNVTGDMPLQNNIWVTRLRPREVEVNLLPPEAQPIRTLRRYIDIVERYTNTGAGERFAANTNIRQLRFYYHSRLAYSFIGLILVALGVPFVIGNERLQRNRMLGIGVCLLICMVFYTVQSISSDLGINGQLPPAVAAWLPTFLFAGLGLYLLEQVHS